MNTGKVGTGPVRKKRLAYLYQKRFAGSFKTINSKCLQEKVIFVEDVLLSVSGREVSLTCNGRPLSEIADVFVPYFVVDAAYSDLYVISIFRALETLGLPVLNNLELYQLCGDKFSTHSMAAICGVNSPKTLMLMPDEMEIEKRVLLLEKNLQYPMFIKPRGMLKSICAVRVDNREQLLPVLQLYSKAELLPIVQEYVPIEKAEYRIYCLGGACLFAYQRTNQLGLVSDRQYVRVQPGVIPDKVLNKCLAMLKRLAPDFVAFDFFSIRGELLLNEIEAFPGVTFIEERDRDLLRRELAKLVALKCKAAVKRKWSES